MKKIVLLLLGLILLTGCQWRSKASEVVITSRGQKVAQIVGQTDKQTNQPTVNQTESRYGLIAADLGSSFSYQDKTYFLFGDAFADQAEKNGRDPIAVSTDTDPSDGLSLEFMTDDQGKWQPITIPDLDQGAFAVPSGGFGLNDSLYVYHTSDSSLNSMNLSVLAKSSDGGKTFSKVYDMSRQHFINISPTLVTNKDWSGLPSKDGQGLLLFGSGRYRQSNVRLAWQPAGTVEDKNTLQYFAGLDKNQKPQWTDEESKAEPMFLQSCVGELSVSYNQYLQKWLMTYNCLQPWRGIHLRTADKPWGPWSEPQLLYHPEQDGGYCQYIHKNWQVDKCDNAYDEGRENVWGGEYAPYQIPSLATGSPGQTTIYFTMSTWNPYTTVLMKADLKLQDKK